jgi:hypothetical protein
LFANGLMQYTHLLLGYVGNVELLAAIGILCQRLHTEHPTLRIGMPLCLL